MTKLQNQSNYQAWSVSLPTNAVDLDMPKKLELIAKFGLLAPSVHNTQPWQFSFGDDSITVSFDPNRKLAEGDATGRQLWISLGCCVESLVIAAAALGLKAAISSSGDVVVIKFAAAEPVNAGLLDLLKQRRSNRNYFETKAVHASLLKQIESAWQSDDVKVQSTSDPQILHLVADLTSRGIQMALSLPAFKNELVHLFRNNLTRQSDGMPGFVFGSNLIGSLVNPFRFKWLDVSASEAKAERQRMLASGGLILTFTSGDTKPFWLQAGRAYMRTAVEATRLGLQHSTSAAAVEAPDFHKEIEKLVGTDHRLQTITRIGYCQSSAPHSPRRSLAETTLTPVP